ncbi:MAG: RNA polymerase factor sigma-54 [Candidatus Tritonobacter lacicola]|nr:RNA polymerase factor sigma-54 [Candidatus Tritonobacter lacicola]
MALKFEQILKQTQTLVLSPQMQQAIKMLQMPLMDLRMLVSQEMAANPILEETMATESAGETGDGDEAPDKDFDEEFAHLSELDDEWREYFRQSGSFRKYTREDEEKRRFMETMITRPESLQDHLLAQLSITATGEQEKMIGEIIIGNIDDNGYLRSTVEELAGMAGCPESEVQVVLEKVQSFHPVGVGARDLRECLLIQLMRLGKQGSLPHIIVRDFLDELARKKYPRISHALKRPLSQVQQAAHFIASLEPKPGRLFGGDPSFYISPDIFLEKTDDGYDVILNDERVPHLRISSFYRGLMAAGRLDPGTKKYIQDKVRGGKWFIKNIALRQKTIYRIAEKIVQEQRDFLDDGISRLRPLTLGDIASSLNISESTVSRAIANKYIQTPQGLLELKFFFSSGLMTDEGEAVSSRNLKNAIARLIEKEDHRKPLSDQGIVDILARKGIRLARRTVAKYRNNLKILPSNLRKQY